MLVIRSSLDSRKVYLVRKIDPFHVTRTMIGGFMRKEPTNSTRLHEYPQVVAIFTRASWMNHEELRATEVKG